MAEDVRQGGGISPWSELIGPFYSDKAISRNGFVERTDLITVTTADNVTVWPQGQFDVGEGDTIVPRETVISFWQEHVAPAIQRGEIDAYTAAEMFFLNREDGLSWADKYAAETEPSAERHRLEALVIGALSRMAH